MLSKPVEGSRVTSPRQKLSLPKISKQHQPSAANYAIQEVPRLRGANRCCQDCARACQSALSNGVSDGMHYRRAEAGDYS
jgi:hypothetical protein